GGGWVDDHRRCLFVYVRLFDFPREAGIELPRSRSPEKSPPGKTQPGRVRPRLNRVWILMAGVDVLLAARMAGNLRGDDREGLRTFPQPVLPRSSGSA